MFNKQIIDSDAFLDMPLSSQALYFHLNMRADDDGFVNNPKKIQRMIQCSNGDLEMLFAKRFVIPFESGICVIKHWLIHNYIRKDTYKETVYTDEKSMLFTKDNKVYTLEPQEQQELLQDSNGVVDEPSRSIDKNSIDKNSIDKNSIDKNSIDKNSASLNDIEEIWKLYPNKKGKADSIKKIPKILKKYSKEQLIKCIENYKKDIQGKDKQYILNGSTFFNGRYMDYLEDVKEKIQAKPVTNIPQHKAFDFSNY
ncbi:MAG: hypothetical protein LIR50_05850 [Bacillota bacterium]|nr:hypothetical protein [Bacillota bacterium]